MNGIIRETQEEKETAILAEGLTKQFQESYAVQNISFEIPRGQSSDSLARVGVGKPRRSGY